MEQQDLFWVQDELSSNVGQVPTKTLGMIPPCSQLLEDGYILAEKLLLHKWQRTSQAISIVVVTGSWKRPREIHAGVP